MAVTIQDPRIARQAITTTWRGPTDTRPSRVIAKSTSGIRVTHTWEYSLGVEGNHAEAARKLCERLGWSGTLACGGLNEDSYVFVFVGEEQG